MTILWLDTETFSECDLKTHGLYRYAEHPSTEIIVAQWALDDDAPVVADCTGRYVPDDLWAALHSGAVIAAHNAQFDRTVIRHVWGLDLPVERWFCTMTQALAHGLPGGLDKVGEVMGLPQDEVKDKRGKQLVQLFCKPLAVNRNLRRATRDTHPAEWAEFLEYSRQDIVSMRAASKAMPHWNYSPDGESPVQAAERRYWALTQRANDRGMAIDLDLARAAVDEAAAQKARITLQAREATAGDVSSLSKRDELLGHILGAYGVELPDLKADTLRRRIEDPELPDGVRLLLELRLEATKTSTAKYNTVLKATSTDGRLRGTMLYAGAARTGRRSHKLFQPGNMPRPKHDDWIVELGADYVKAGAAGMLTDNPMLLLADLVRGLIVAPDGRVLVQSDLANIEGRGLAWLAGEAWKLDAFRAFDAGTGPDLYVAAYSRSFAVDPASVTGKQRQIGKVQELGLGYGGGVAAFLTFAAVYEMDLTELADAVHSTAPKPALAAAYGMWEWAVKKRRTLGLERNVYVACEVLKAAWRAAHPATEQLWADLDAAFRRAIAAPGVLHKAGEHLGLRRDGAWLRMRLPSGRCLCYLHPQVDDKGQLSYAGVSPYTHRWGRVKTYGGKLAENATQAFAADIMKHGQLRADCAGYPTVLDVHDEVLAEVDADAGLDHEGLSRWLSTPPHWAPDIPLSAKGFSTSRYHKE